MLAAVVALALFSVGDLATFIRPGTPDRICARVSTLELGPGGARYAWLVVVSGGAPHGLEHLPLAELAPGCAWEIFT